MAASEQTVTLVIKNPYSANAESAFRRDVPLAFTLGEVKMLLEAEYDGNPPAAAQRIIHAGKMHGDDVPLTDVFGAGAAYSDLTITKQGDVGFVFERGPSDRYPYAYLSFGKVPAGVSNRA